MARWFRRLNDTIHRRPKTIAEVFGGHVTLLNDRGWRYEQKRKINYLDFENGNITSACFRFLRDPNYRFSNIDLRILEKVIEKFENNLEKRAQTIAGNRLVELKDKGRRVLEDLYTIRSSIELRIKGYTLDDYVSNNKFIPVRTIPQAIGTIQEVEGKRRRIFAAKRTLDEQNIPYRFAGPEKKDLVQVKVRFGKGLWARIRERVSRKPVVVNIYNTQVYNLSK